MGKSGNISSNMPTEAQCLASLSDWYDHKEVNMSTESGNVVISTAFPTLICKGFKNLSTTAEGVVKYTTKNDPEAVKTFPLDVREFSGKLAEIHTIVKTDTTATSLLLYFQKL